MQCNGNSVIANDLERALRHADLCFLNREALLAQRFSDIEVGDGTEQAAIDASLLCDLNGQAIQLFALGLCCSKFFSSGFFQFGTLDFEFSNGSSRGTTGFALRDQEVASETVFDANDFTE